METLTEPSGSFIVEPTHAMPVSKATERRWLLAYDGFNIATSINFSSAIWIIYLATHGYNPFEIGLLETLLHLSKFVFDVPTGIFADLVGRRASLLLYSVLAFSSALFFIWPTPVIMILSFTLLGLSIAFRSGANEALLWTISGSIAPQDQPRRYSRLVSRMFMVSLVGEVIATATGGLLGNLLAILPFICQAAAIAIGTIPIFLLPEQRIERQQRSNPLRHFGRGLRAAWSNSLLLSILLLSGLMEACWTTVYFFNQLYLHGLGFSLVAVGLVIAASLGTNFLFTAWAPRLIERLPLRWLLLCCLLAEIGGLLLMSTSSVVLSLIGFLGLFQLSIAVLSPAASTYINMRCPEAQRATVLSLQTGLFSAAMIVLFPLFGLGASHIPYSVIYLWAAIALSVGGTAILALKLGLDTFRARHS